MKFFKELKVARKAQLVYLAAEEVKLAKFTKLKDGLGFKMKDNENGKIIVTKKTKFCTGCTSFLMYQLKNSKKFFTHNKFRSFDS